MGPAASDVPRLIYGSFLSLLFTPKNNCSEAEQQSQSPLLSAKTPSSTRRVTAGSAAAWP